MAGPFDAYFEEVKKRDAASTATRVRLNPLDPGQAAENLAAAKELGAPAGQVMAFPELYKDKLAQKRATTALADAPQLSDWLRSDPVNAALAKDDLENAAWWERTFRGGWNAANRGTQSVGQSLRQFQATQSQQRATDLKQGFMDILDSERESVVVDGVERKQFVSPGDVVGAAYRFGMSRLSAVMGNDDAAKAVEFQQQAGKIRERISSIPMTPGGERFRDRMGSIDANASVTDQIRQFAEKVAEDPGDFASFMLQVGAESIPSMAVAGATTAVTRSPTAGAAALGVGSGAREYGSTVTDELASTGYDLTTPEGAMAALNDTGLLDRAKQKGNARALVIGIMDGMSGGVAGKALMQSPVGNVIAQGLAQAVMAGAGEAAGQFASEGRVTSIPDILIEAMADMVTAPAEIGSVAGRGLFRPQQQIAQAGGTAAILDTASQQAQASQLRERSPERFKEMLDKSGGGEQLVYVPAQGLRELFQSKDVPFEDMADAWGIDPATMAEMELTGGRVAVPMSNFAAYIAGTDAEAWVRENATMGPDELSLSEAQSYADLVPDDMADAYERQVQEMRDEDAKRSSDQQVFDGFYSQLREAGRTADVADKEARVMSAFFRTMAGRIGEDSLELAQRFGVKVQGMQSADVARRRGSLDIMLNDLRSGRKEKLGRSLTQFVIDQGGVQDTGGDVAALEVKGLVAETAEQIRAREAQGTMPGQMPAQGKGLALDELGRKAVESGYFPELMGEVQGLNDGEAADLGRALLEALREEASGRLRYREGEGPDPAREALNAALQERGLDPATMSNDEIAAALEGREYGQDKEALRAKIDEFQKATEADLGLRSLSLFLSGDDLKLNMIAVAKENQGKGAGSEAMRRILAFADENGLRITLTPGLPNDGFGTTSRSRLVKFYKQFGFVENKGRNKDFSISEGMYREPGRKLRQDRRGSIVLPRDGVLAGETVINLFESADLSTFFHEAGHFFLETMNALAADPAAPQAIRDDMAAVRKHLEAEEGQPFTEDQHETFARSFEAYLMEGKAPSLELADVFARVKEWLVRIYRDIRGLNVKLSPQIREVFDRMLASEAEIAAAREDMAASPLFREKPAGMSDADWTTYQRMARRSKDEADAKLRERVLEKVRREKEAWWKAERKQLRAEVEAHTNALPQYRLIEAMANGRVLVSPDEVVDAADVRISRKELVEQFGAGVLPELSRERFGGKRAIYADDGIPPALAAEMFGFAGPVEMVQILQNTRKRVEAIDVETDRIMAERYGDPFTDGTIEQEAVDAIHSEQQAQKNVAEARQMAKQMGRDTRGMTASLYRQRARLMLGRMTVREASASNRFLAAERRAGRDAERAFGKVARGNANALAEALQAKEQQILNAALYDLSREAEREVSRAREKMQAYGKKSVRQKLEGGYIEQIDDLLDRYDFRKQSPGQIAKTERLRDFVDRMVAEGREAELMIDPRMMDEARRVHYSRVSLDEFRGLVDTIANLDHLGRFKQQLIDARKRRDLNDTAASVAENIAKNIGTGRIKKESRIRSVLDLVLTADSVLVDVDGGDEFGTSYQAIKEDIDAGYVRVDEMNRELSEKLTDLFKVYSAKDMRDMKVERHIDGTRFSWSKWKAIAVALNTGNEDNMARLLAEDAHPDQRMTQADLDAVLGTLDKRDWDFVQSMWDTINGYWPEISEVTQRRTGVKPSKVEARPVETKFGTYPGGYYPIKYDPGYGHAAAVDARTEMDKFMSAGRFSKAQTKHGHTIERKKTGNGRTLNLDIDVAFTHMRDVIRDIALSEAVDNAYRVMNHGAVAQAFMEAGRKNDLDMMNLWLKDVAQGPIVHSDPLNQFARFVKNNFTLSRLALNFKTAAMQVTGVAQSAATVGKGAMARAFADYLKRPAGVSAEVMAKSEFMQRRQTTFDKDIIDFKNDTNIASPTRGRIAKSADTLAKVGFAPLTKVQFYAVDVPTWLAGYRNGLRKFDGNESRAIAFADRMVARAQDSGAIPDRTAVSRGTLSENIRQAEWVKLFTTLQGYMLAKFNRGYLTARQGARDIRGAESTVEAIGATANMAANLMLIYVAETAMMGIAYALMADGDDDDEKMEKLFTWMATETVGTVVGGLPLVRDGWSVMSNPAATGGGVYGSITEMPARIVQQVSQGENDPALRRALADAFGTITGLPTTAVMRPIEEMLKENDERSWMKALMGRNPIAD